MGFVSVDVSLILKEEQKRTNRLLYGEVVYRPLEVLGILFLTQVFLSKE